MHLFVSKILEQSLLNNLRRNTEAFFDFLPQNENIAIRNAGLGQFYLTKALVGRNHPNLGSSKTFWRKPTFFSTFTKLIEKRFGVPP
jgi:hypothetical protein